MKKPTKAEQKQISSYIQKELRANPKMNPKQAAAIAYSKTEQKRKKSK